MKHNRFYNVMQRVMVAGLCVTAFAACSTEESIDDVAQSNNATTRLLSITAEIEPNAGTRVDGLDATTFEAGDTIGLYIINSDSDIYGDSISSINVPAVYNGSTWTILEDIVLTEDSAVILGYYPYDENNDEESIYLSIDGKTDYLTSRTLANSEDSVAALTFNHVMSRITLSLSTSEGSVNLSSVGVKGYVVTEESLFLKLSGYGWEDVLIEFDEDDVFTQTMDCGNVTITSTEKTDIDILVWPISEVVTDNSIVLTVNGADYEVSLANSSITSWEAGHQYTYPITIDIAEGATLDVSDITGTYSGTMDVSVNSITLISGEETTVTIAEVDDSTVTASWSGSVTINGLSIPLTIDCDCSVTLTDDGTALEGSTTMDITTLGYNGLSVTMAGNTYTENDSLSLTITISSINAVVVFNGVRSSSSTADDDTSEDESSTNYNGYEAVDLGLSVKWATCNVGADSPEDYGNYYAWGEIETKDSYTSSTSVTYGVEMDDISGNAEYDAATANWGGSWRMPTDDEMDELVSDCTWTWTTQNDVAGYLVTGSNGNSIFLPAAGYRTGTSLSNAGELGRYWSSSPNGGSSFNACGLYFDSTYHGTGWGSRLNGFSVRPVSE